MPSTNRTSAEASASASSPRAMRLISLSGRYVLKRASIASRRASIASTTDSGIPGSRTSMLMTVPMIGATRCGPRAGPLA